MSLQEKASDGGHDKPQVSMLEEVALAGHTGTDDQGRPILARDEAAEARLRMKMDLHIIPVIAIIYLFCFRIEKELHMTGYDYNILLSAFYVAYAVFELPMTLLCKKVGPAKFLPISTFFFGLFALCSGFITTFHQGIAAIFPGIAYYLTRFYRKEEFVFRLSMYVVSAPLAGAFGGLLASGILKLNSVGQYRSWRMIFIIEGILTMGVGIISWFLLSGSPETASWLTAEEKALAVARIKSENVGSTVVVDQMSRKAVLDGCFAPTTLLVSLIFMLDNITVQGMGFFLPTIIKTIYPQKTTIQLQLQTVPPYIVGSFFCLLVPYLGWKTNRRALWMTISAPLIIVGYIMFLASKNPQVRYATSDSMRAGAIGTVVMFGNLGGLVATWTYLPRDAPQYKRGNSVNLGTSSAILGLTVATWAWQAWQNRKKERGHHDHVLDGKSTEEIEHLGTAHPAFRYLH
ncbi:hypothetical protein RQP46_001704 [Phenoliferia psychrophenolica]